MNYDQFINHIINNRGRFNCIGYFEKHHIIPKCIGGSDDLDNLIYLYPEEHYNAHKLLALENPKQYSLVYAWWCMANCYNDFQKCRYKISDLEYGELKRAYSEMVKNKLSKNNPLKGRKLSEEHKHKIALSHMGKKQSNETIQKRVAKLKGIKRDTSKIRELSKTPEALKKLSESHKGLKHSDETKLKMKMKKIEQYKPVLQYDKNGLLLMEFNCISDAAKAMNTYPTNISRCCNNKRKTACGYIWKFKI